jgi:hypothetical protein
MNYLLGINILHEHKLYGWSQVTIQCFVSVCHIYSVSIYNILIWICELYKGDRLQLTVCVCYSWETALDIDLNMSFNNM